MSLNHLTRTDLPTWPDLHATAASIMAAQEASGAIPWEAGRHVDAWNHVEGAMALLTAGERAAAEQAYEWLRVTQRADGSWPTKVTGGVVTEPAADTNQCGYVAVGLWHHWLVCADRGIVEHLWPTVCRALDFVAAQQLSFGGIAWVVDPGEVRSSEALLTGSASLWHALDCGLRLGNLLGQDVSRWQPVADALEVAVAQREDAFLDKSRYAMDWYYPVLAGPVRGEAARARLQARWDEFVVPGLGIHCVADQPWVTGAETCELAIALAGLGDRDGAATLVADMQHLRDESGSYHTGFVYPDNARWPGEQATWTAAAVILAMDVLTDHTPGAQVFRFED